MEHNEKLTMTLFLILMGFLPYKRNLIPIVAQTYKLITMIFSVLVDLLPSKVNSFHIVAPNK